MNTLAAASLLRPRTEDRRESPGVGTVVLRVARGAIAEALGFASYADESPAWLRKRGACFVTLRKDGELRGCIGSLEARRELVVDLRENALAAAFHDPRFEPLSSHEFPRTRVEVSILSAPEPIPSKDEADLKKHLQPGVDGIVLVHRGRRATFLPQVWEQLPKVDDFLAALKQKAGLPVDFWAPEMTVSRYTVDKYAEHDAPRARR